MDTARFNNIDTKYLAYKLERREDSILNDTINVKYVDVVNSGVAVAV